MNSIKLKSDLINYLNDNYFFVKPEIYSYFNINSNLFFAHKKDLFYNHNKEAIENMSLLEFLEGNISKNNWKKYNESNHIKWFADEFRWTGLKYKSTEIEVVIKEIFQNFELYKTLNCPNGIIDILKEDRIDCSKIQTVDNEYERDFEIFNTNDKIYFNENKSKLSNPGIILSKNSDEDLKILYFTNLDKYAKETNLKKINGWCIQRVTSKEIGKTPEQAKQNSYL